MKERIQQFLDNNEIEDYPDLLLSAGTNPDKFRDYFGIWNKENKRMLIRICKYSSFWEVQLFIL